MKIAIIEISAQMKPTVLYPISNPFIFERSPVGGYISHAKGVYDGLREHGFHVTTVSDSPPHFVDNTKDLTNIIYPLQKLRRFITKQKNPFCKRLETLLFRVSMKKKLSSLLRTQTYSFMYLRASYQGHIAAQVAKQFSIPLVLEVNKPLSMGPYNKSNGPPWPTSSDDVQVPISERIQYDAAKIITVDSPIRAQWILDFVDKRYEEKIVVNPSGVDTHLFSPKNCIAQTRKALKIPSSAFVIGMASSFRWYNDIDELLKIFSGVKKNVPDVKFLLIIGDGERVEPIKKAINQHNLEAEVILCAQIPFQEMPFILDCCDILVSHFNFHGKWPHNCSMKHMEYLAMGKPVIATKAGFVNFAVEDGCNGFLIEEGDIYGYINAIETLAADRPLREELGRHGRLKAQKDLSWRENVNKFITPLTFQTFYTNQDYYSIF